MNFSCFSKQVLSRPQTKWLHENAYDQRATMLSAGYFQGNFSLLNNYVRQFGDASGFSPFYKTAGLDWIVRAGGHYGEWNATINTELILKQEITEGDSEKFRMRGFHSMYSIFTYDFFKANKNLAFEIAPGMNFGELSIRETSKVQTTKYINPFVAPLVRTEFRVVFPFHLAVGIRALYQFDITSPRWKLLTASNGFVHLDSGLAHTRFSGLGFQVFIGYGKTIKN